MLSKEKFEFLNLFFSSKFSKKVFYIDQLEQLSSLVDLRQILPSQSVRLDPTVINSINFQYSLSSWVAQNSFVPSIVENLFFSGVRGETNQQIPTIVRQSVEFLKRFALEQENIFCRSAAPSLVEEIFQRYNAGKISFFFSFKKLKQEKSSNTNHDDRLEKEKSEFLSEI